MRKDRAVQRGQVFQGKLTTVCEFPFVRFEVRFLFQLKRTAVPSGTDESGTRRPHDLRRVLRQIEPNLGGILVNHLRRIETREQVEVICEANVELCRPFLAGYEDTCAAKEGMAADA